MKAQKFEIVIPVWPDRPSFGYSGRLGYTTDYGYSTECDSEYIPLRAVIEGDKYPYFNDEVKSINDLCLYVWFDKKGSVSIDVRHSGDSGHATLREVEAIARQMKKIINKMSKKFSLGNFTSNVSIHDSLTLALDALGVKRCVEYRGLGIDDIYKPIGIAVSNISGVLETRKANIRENQVA